MALVVVLVGYPLSIGPACWISSRTNTGAAVVSKVYRPLTWGMSKSEFTAIAVSWYSELGSAKFWEWVDGKTWAKNWLYSPEAIPITRRFRAD